MNSKVQRKNCKGTDWNNMPSQNSRAHGCAFSSDHAFCSGHAQERVFENTRHVRLIRLEPATGMSDSDAIRCKMSTSCISKPAWCKAQFFIKQTSTWPCFPKFRVELVMCSHATGRLILPFRSVRETSAVVSRVRNQTREKYTPSNFSYVKARTWATVQNASQGFFCTKRRTWDNLFAFAFIL